MGLIDSAELKEKAEAAERVVIILETHLADELVKVGEQSFFGGELAVAFERMAGEYKQGAERNERRGV